MLRDRNIAFFIDVDNVGLKSENYANVIEQLNAMGTILSGKIYGAGERKHKEIFADAELHGYQIERAMRVKRRGRKEFDPRIFVDVVEAVSRTNAIDAVCIIAQPTDLVYLYSFLRARGIKIVALDNADDASCAFIDEVIDLGIVFELKLPQQPKTQPAAKPAAAVEASPAQPEQSQAQGLDRTDELLREIERLRNEVPVEPTRQEHSFEESVNTEQQTAEAVEEQPEQPAEPQEEALSENERTASIVDEARSLLERIAEMRGEQGEQPAEQPAEAEQQEQPTEQTETAAPVEETPVEETPVEEAPAEQQPTEQAEQSPAEQPQSYEPVVQEEPVEELARQASSRAPLSSSNDSDLIKRIEEIRRNSQGGEDDFVEEIRKLLDGLE